MLRSDLCEYSDAYIAVKRIIIVTCTNNANKRNNKLTSRIALHLDQTYQKSITHL